MEKKYSILAPEKSKKDLQEEQLYSNKQVSFSQRYATFLRGHMFVQSYGVSTKIYDAQKNKRSEVQFDAEVTMRQFPDLGYFEYMIKKEKIFINKQVPKTLVEKLAIITSKALYPLKIKTSFKNELLSIVNHDEVVARWENIKIQLQKEYEGEAFTLYIKKFESALYKESSLLASLKREAFYVLLFHDTYTMYDEKLQKEAEIHFPVSGFKVPLVFKGIQKISKYRTYYDMVLTRFESMVSNTTTQATLNVEFDLDNNTFLLKNAIANCNIKNNETILKTVTTTVYHLTEKPTKYYSFEEQKKDIKQRQKAIQKEKNKDLTLKQRFYNWLNN
ncbi:hypothetical protein R5N98_05415 [Tenacibaculum maritimum]|uniref:hypothetical protein n=1 Tax=Tenacibaculum maritimum TaxID=107401 RepID=UPI003875ECC2